MKDRPKTAARRFEPIFEHYPLVVAFAARRGSRDSEGIAAETMAIAWRRLADIDPDSCRPWLLATARNLLLAEYRDRKHETIDLSTIDPIDRFAPAFSFESLDPDIDATLKSLDPIDREALTLIAWEELSPKEAAKSLGMKPAAFRVRLHRARRKFRKSIDELDRTPRPLPLTSEESP